MGPVASQEAIKQLGTNGGGFFNANAAHPFENPNPLTNFLSMFLIFAIPAGLTYTFGRMARRPAAGLGALRRDGVPVLRRASTVAYWAEARGQPDRSRGLGVEPGLGNMEGKEVRFGVANSALYATVTTDASCGAVNSMHDSFTPLGGLVPLFNIQLGEVVFGGVGAGPLRDAGDGDPLRLHRRADGRAARPSTSARRSRRARSSSRCSTCSIFPLVILAFAAWSAVAPYGLSSLNNAGPHGLSRDPLRLHERRRQQRLRVRGHQRQHALVQHRARPGHARSGASDDRARPGHRRHPGRQEGRRRPGPGTLPTTGPLFAALLVGVIVIVGALTFFPVLSLGPDRRALPGPGRKGVLSHERKRAEPSRPGTGRSCARRSSTASASSTRGCMAKNPVMFVVEVGSVLTTLIWLRDLVAPAAGRAARLVHRPGRRSGSGSRSSSRTSPRRWPRAAARRRPPRCAACARRRWPASCVDGREERVPASTLRKGDVVVVEAGEVIPGDGEVIEGIASVDESAVTGESAPVIRESGGDRSAVTGGTKVLSDRIVVRIGVDPGESFLDRMIGLVEGRQAPEDARTRSRCTSCSSGMTIIFLIACVTLVPFGALLRPALLRHRDRGAARVPDPDHDRRPALRHRHRGHGPPDPPQRDPHERPRGGGGGRRGHDAARQDRHHHPRQPHGERVPARARACASEELADAAQLASLADETPEGRSIVVLAKEQLRPARPRARSSPRRAFVPFTGADADERLRPRRPRDPQGRGRRDRAPRGGARRQRAAGGRAGGRHASRKSGGTPLAVSDGARVLGVVHLKDIVKGGIKERFARFRAMGLRTVMITGDNPLTAAAIAARGRGRRLPGRGHARDEARAHPRGAGQGQARRHDRRRHQRRARAGPGRRRPSP